MLCRRSTWPASVKSSIRRYIKAQNASQPSFRRPSQPKNCCWSSTQATVTPASPISSVTSVDAIKGLPKERQELHNALTTLKLRGGSYVNLSQVELALRGLESEKTVIRIAILGVNGIGSAAKLLRTLLADPLKPEEQWESDLADKAAKDGRGILVRYGETYDYDSRNRLLQTLSVPAAHLHQNEVEYLIHNFTPDGTNGSNLGKSDNLLTPMVEIPNSASGRVSMIRHPVHRALIFAEGIQGLLAVVNSLQGSNKGPTGRAIRGVVDNDWGENELQGVTGVLSVQIQPAEDAVASLRKSIENATNYERLWLQSRVSSVAQWLEDSSSARSLALKPALKTLIDIVLEGTQQKISSETSQQLLQNETNQVSQDVRQSLQKALTSWAESSHTDLQYSLEMAFQSKYWTGLAWWKLPWHIDDVEMFLTHLIKNFWLVEPEKWMIYLGGRMNQAGIDVLTLNSTAEELRAKLLQYEPSQHAKPAQNSAQLPPPTPRPTQTSQWTQTVGLSRALAIHTLFIPLQATGQRLLWQAYGLTTLASTLASLMYMSISTTSLYEVGAVAAIGLVYSARRLQTRWEAERAKLKWMLRQAARSPVKRFEEEARRAIELGGMGDSEVVAQDREEVKEAVEKVRMTLGKMDEAAVSEGE